MTRVAVLYGGISAEREVSLSTGRQVIAALREAGYEVTPIEVKDDLAAVIRALDPRPDAMVGDVLVVGVGARRLDSGRGRRHLCRRPVGNRHPRFSEERVNASRESVAALADRPGVLVHQLLQRGALPGHPVGSVAAGGARRARDVVVHGACVLRIQQV